MNQGKLRFGTDVDAQLNKWWQSEGLAELRAKYGTDAIIYFAALDPAVPERWNHKNPLKQLLYTLDTLGPREPANAYIYGPTGLMSNVEGKLAFVLRTHLNSVEAERRPDLVEPGDFPHEGAGFYRGYPGGVSGLKAKDDWEVYRWIIDKIIELRAAAAKPALKASKDREPEDGPNVKYLRGAWELGEDGVARMCADPAEAGSGTAPLKLVRIAGGVGDDPQGHANSK